MRTGFFELTHLACRECARPFGSPRYQVPYRVPRCCGLARDQTVPNPPRRSDLSCPTP